MHLSIKAVEAKVSVRISSGILVFTVAVSLSHFIVLLGFDILIQNHTFYIYMSTI